MGDSALVVWFGEIIDHAVYRRVHSLALQLAQHPIRGMIEYVPAYATVTIYYDPMQQSFAGAKVELQTTLLNLRDESLKDQRTVEIPVCYGGDYGPDLEFVAQHNSLTEEKVVAIHSAADYLVYMIGFAPGFPYLGGMSEQIAAPRRESPRLQIPAGSVGIAGAQTGVYPIETPGGWQLIGRTPLELFRPTEDPPTRLRAGDIVRFRPITSEEFDRLRMSPP